MYSEKELEEREYQLELVNLQIKADSMMATSLTMLAVAATFVAVGLTMASSIIGWGAYVASIILIGMSIKNIQDYKGDNKEQKNKILNKYVNKYKIKENKNNV